MHHKFHDDGIKRDVSVLPCALLLALLSAAAPLFAPDARALEACFADSVGPWRGPVVSAGEIQMLDTEFRLGGDGVLSGSYHVEATPPYGGTLDSFHETGPCEADFVWHDRFGEGVVHIRFEPDRSRFLGLWGTIGPVSGYLFNGYRDAPPAVS